MFQMGKLLLLSVVSAFGTASVAANAIANTISSFQVLAPQSIGLGMVTVVSRCVGAGEFSNARIYTRKLMRWGYVAMLVINLLIFALLPLLLRLYNLSEEATDYARILLLLHGGIGILLWPAAFQLPQTLRAAGDTRFTMLVSSASMWMFRVVLGVIMAKYLQMGVLGMWGAMFVDWAVRSVVFLLRYRGHRWESKALKD
jgi:Na+-driven multidrug efflux pump